MTEARPFASLSSGLLARKGAAKPAMRPQGFGPIGGAGLEDLGWNDMGHPGEDARPVEALPEHVPSSIAALTPAPRSADAPPAGEPPVMEQRRAIAESFGADEEAAPAPEEIRAAEPAQIVSLPKRPSANGKGKKSAFTLRLDPERHFRLRLACALTGRSAQQIVTGALDQWLETLPEIDALADRVPASGAKRS